MCSVEHTAESSVDEMVENDAQISAEQKLFDTDMLTIVWLHKGKDIQEELERKLYLQRSCPRRSDQMSSAAIEYVL